MPISAVFDVVRGCILPTLKALWQTAGTRAETNRQPTRARGAAKVKLKLADKRSALVDLGKHIGMFRDKEAAGETGLTPKQHAEMTAFLEACRMRKADVTEIEWK